MTLITPKEPIREAIERINDLRANIDDSLNFVSSLDFIEKNGTDDYSEVFNEEIYAFIDYFRENKHTIEQFSSEMESFAQALNKLQKIIDAYLA